MLAVTTYRYRRQRTDEPLRTKLVELAREKPRFGYRRLHVLLRRSGEQVNHKRIHRIYREAGLMIRRKKRKHGVRVGQPLRNWTAANQEWALDFAHDAVACGRNAGAGRNRKALQALHTSKDQNDPSQRTYDSSGDEPLAWSYQERGS